MCVYKKHHNRDWEVSYLKLFYNFVVGKYINIVGV